jgi:hypothetical protein
VAPSSPKRTVYFAPARRALVDVDARAEGGELLPPTTLPGGDPATDRPAMQVA